MTTIATYDHRASALDDPERFWDEVEEILNDQGDTDGELISKELHTSLANFFALCDACYDIYLDHQNNVDYLLTRLLDSPLIQSASLDASTNALTTLAVSATSLPTLFLLYETLLKLSSQTQSLFRTSASSKQLIPRLVHHFWAARYAEEYIQRHGESAASLSKLKGEDSTHEGKGLEWNLKHIRNISQGNAERESVDRRNRVVQIRLREQSVSLLYEICRSHRLTSGDMRAIDATFVNHLFELVEWSRNWHDDAYNYNLIKLIVSLNEQFMVSGISSASSKPAARKSTASASNTVLTVLRTRLNASKTFGENVIFMLNRASSLDAEDICMQLLILKLLYLLFTTKETAHYFYTNDLKVLVDIFIRELSDLPDDHESLRHTYLRVLHPLLTNTQLLTYPYKRMQIRRLLNGLTSHGHLREISSTTQRLVDRCLGAQWCIDLDAAGHPSTGTSAAADETSGSFRTHTFAVQSVGGGPSTLVEAQAVVDAEGISIPLHLESEERSQDVSSTSFSAIRASDEAAVPISNSHGSEHGTSKHTAGEPARVRTSRVRSADGISSQVRETLQGMSECLAAAEGVQDREDVSSDSATQATHVDQRDTSLAYVRKAVDSASLQPSPADLERAIFAKRVHSALDVSRLSEEDVYGSENESEQWIGSPMNGSWHQSMSEDRKISSGGPRKRAGTGASLVTSPLRDSHMHGTVDESSSASGTCETSFDVTDVPQVHVHQPSGEECDDVQNASGSAILRRRPPAPPTARSDSGDSRSKIRIRSMGLHPSPSDSSLAQRILQQVDDERTNDSAYAPVQGIALVSGRLLNAVSTPVSPGDGSRNASRSASPLSDPVNAVPTSSSSRRRRPPPPPVDRSTKTGGRSQLDTVRKSAPYLSDDRNTHDETASRVEEEREQDSYTHPPATALVQNQQSISRYMSDMKLTGSNGYGW